LVEPVAVAAARHRVAVADRGRDAVVVWAVRTSRLVAHFPFPDPAVIAFAPDGDIVVAGQDSAVLNFFDPSGLPRRTVDTRLPGAIVRIGFGPSQGLTGIGPCVSWLVIEHQGVLTLWRSDAGSYDFGPAAFTELTDSIAASTLRVVTERGFCLQEPSGSGTETTTCFDWYGREATKEHVGGSALTPLLTQGQLLTGPIDSGVPRCRWHRVRVEADVPEGTRLAVAVTTSEDPNPPTQGALQLDPGWEAFAPGVPHPDDWQTAPSDALDYLIQQPPGRYLFLRMRLTGDGTLTPLARRIRLDFPRSTSLSKLPAVYSQDPAAEDFSERFLALFDASIEDLDRHIARHPALLDAAGIPDSALPWLADFVGVAFAPEWGIAQRRALVVAAPELYRTRGTPAGLRRAVELVFGVNPVIEELGPARAWGTVGRDARLRSTRLFGKGRARVRLGSSQLSRAPIRSYGNPDDDARTAGAFRIRVLVPRSAGMTPTDRARVRRLIAAQAPAHTVPEVTFGGDGFLLGVRSAVGVDTALAPLPAAVLGGPGGNVRLGRQTVLWPTCPGGASGVALDARSVVGVSVLME
jgi:phage tail-like protein